MNNINQDLYNIDKFKDNKFILYDEFLKDKENLLEKIYETEIFKSFIKLLYDNSGAIDDALNIKKYNDIIFEILLEYSDEINEVLYKNIRNIILYKRFDYIEKNIEWSIKSDHYIDCINMMFCEIYNIYKNNITEIINFLDYFKSKNILNDHFICYIICHLESRFNIILILENYVMNFTDLIYHMSFVNLDNINIILEYMIIKEIKLDNFNDDFIHEDFLRYIIKKDIYYEILDEYIETNPIINQLDNKLKIVLEDNEIPYTHYIKYFIKHLYNKLNDQTKLIINDSLQMIFTNDKNTSDYLVSEYIYHNAIHDMMKNYIKNEIERNVNNICYINYYLKYYYVKDDNNIWLIDKYIKSIFRYVIAYLGNNDIYNDDLFDYINGYVDKILNNKIEEIDITLFDMKTNKLIFYIFYYYYKNNKNYDKILLHVKNRLKNTDILYDIMNYNIYLSKDEDDIIYDYIINLEKYDKYIIEYVINNYNDDKDEKIKSIKLKIYEYINKNKITDIEHKIIKKYFSNNNNKENKFNNYLEKYKKICEDINEEINLGKDVVDIIYTYGCL